MAKFERNEDRPEQVEGKEKDFEPVKEPNIIDLFNGISKRLEVSLNKIGNNIQRVVEMID